MRKMLFVIVDQRLYLPNTKTHYDQMTFTMSHKKTRLKVAVPTFAFHCKHHQRNNKKILKERQITCTTVMYK